MNTAGARLLSQVNRNKKYTKQTRRAMTRRAQNQIDEGAAKGRKIKANNALLDAKVTASLKEGKKGNRDAIMRAKTMKDLQKTLRNIENSKASSERFHKQNDEKVATSRQESDANWRERGAISKHSNRPTGNGSKKKKRQLSKADKRFLQNMNSGIRFSEDYDLKLKL